MKLHKELRRLAQGVLDTAYLGNLAADVEVNQLEAILQLLAFQEVECFEQFATGQAELAGVSAALFPLAAAARGQLDTNADVGAHTQLLGHLGDKVQFVEFLHHQEDAFAHLLRQQGHFDEALVLVAVAHHERVGVGIDANYGMQFWLRTRFKAQVKLLAVGNHLLHHGSHLVHLDGVDNEVLSLVAILGSSLFEAARHFFDAVVEDVGESDQHGSRHVAQLQFVHQFPQVHGHAIFLGGDHYMALLIDTKVRSAPSRDVVELFGVFNTPFSH